MADPESADEDRETLVAFHTDCNGTEWHANTGWTAGSLALSEWFGVTASSTANVAGICLPSNNLSGIGSS